MRPVASDGPTARLVRSQRVEPAIEPGAPESSILIFRMNSTEAGIAMPELGRQLVHEEAIQVLSEWIAAMPGSCD